MKPDGTTCGLPKFSIELAVFLMSLALMAPPPASGSAQPGSGRTDSWHRASSSWAIGVVVPNGAGLEQGESLSWRAASNLTAVVVLPYFTRPDAITYVGLSAIGCDRTIF